MKVRNFKKAIDNIFPNEEKYLLYIYDNFGRILFKDEWSKFSLFEVSKAKYWPKIDGILLILGKMSFDKQSIIVNHIFSKSANNLIKILR